MIRRVNAEALHARLLDKDEIALLDVREAADFVVEHLNLASHLPLSQLELSVRALVPRLGTSVVLCDDGSSSDDFVQRAAGILARLGYTDVSVLEGGVRAWKESGFVASRGDGTLVRAFADQARLRYATPTIAPADLKARLEEGRPTTVIDVRTTSEYLFASIPEARNYPGVELPTHRLESPHPDHLWVINCFSRTRGIIGTTTMILLKEIDNVAFLDDGVMSWFVHGFDTAHGTMPVDDIPLENDGALAARAEQIIRRYQLQIISPEVLAQWRTDPERTLYVFDVRLAGAGARPESGVVNVAGGQLLMHYDTHVATRRARIVLVDDTHLLRAAVSAFWLSQLGDAEIFILRGLPGPYRSATDQRDWDPDGNLGISVGELASLIEDDGVTVIDVGPSARYVKGHIPGAYYMVSSALPAVNLKRFAKPMVFVSPDSLAAQLAARDAADLGITNVRWLRGGTDEWADQGRSIKIEWEDEHLLTEFSDDWGSIMRLAPGRRQSVYPEFLAWERAVALNMQADDTVRFRFFAHPACDHDR